MGILRNITSLLVTYVFLAGSLQCTKAANILVWGAVGSHSTRLSMFPMMEALVERGHQVTFLSGYDNIEDPEKTSKITYYTPPKWKQVMGSTVEEYPAFEVRKAGTNPAGWVECLDWGVMACENLYSDPEFVKWVKTSTKYDLIITEGVVNECAFGLVHLHNSKLVTYGTTIPFPWFHEGFGFPEETSSIPDVMFDFPAGDRMSFLQRVKNALVPIVFGVKREYFYFPTLEEITRKGLGLEKEELPRFREIERRTSLVFLTTHVTIDLPRSLPPHVIPIGGAVVNKKPKPLSPEVEKFLNEAADGFIYISFGTVAEFATFDRDVQLEFIRALGFFPKIKFLWKASVGINETLPDNVMLSKWLPQQTVLGHPKIKAFVTHCGMGSVTEAVNFAVPLVLIPVLDDQNGNADVMESRGVGVRLEITTLKKEELENAIVEVLSNDRYRLSMKKLSAAFKDRAIQPLENAVWWIEYILRHDNSNDYLVPLSVHQPWWKRRQLDVWLFLGGCLFVAASLSLIVIFRIIKAVFKLMFASADKKNQRQGKLKAN